MNHDFNNPPPSYALPADWKLGEEREYLTEQVWLQVVRGVTDVSEYLDLFEEELDEAGVSEEQARRWFESVIALRRAQQASWGEAPKARINAAFEELASIGVVARQDFSCCGTCASGEIWDERDDSRTWRGYVYYHQQDTDSLIESGTTYVGYGVFLDSMYTQKEWEAFPPDEQQSRHERHVRELMAEVQRVLEGHQIEVDWDGDLSRRILLGNVDFFAPMPAA